ncbi:MAG: VIT and VWA domain-containing protein [Bryobacteraceae bacterium]
MKTAFALLLSAACFGDTGSLTSEKGACPLKHTAVKAEVSGPLARVTVTQKFANPYQEKIEAVYTFPLPASAAVDDMTMLVGGRTIRGVIKPREEARAMYEAARRSGRMAGLLDQERPNIFTQAVANIPPGGAVDITISYVETLDYEAGSYTFSFPMVVGPRYIPRRGVLDAGRITPPVTPQGTRAGHDISVQLTLDAGVPVDGVTSPTHDVAITRPDARRYAVALRDKAVIPNKDFILKWDVAGRRVEDAVLAHRDARGGFFTLILQPPERVAVADISPKELVFVLDTSGSMMGFPIEKAKETMRLALDGLNPRDTFNLITFSGDTRILFPSPVPATPENLRAAQQFLASRHGSGGTEMMKAIRAALDGAGENGHIRVVCFMTDGFVGNDFEILAEIQHHPAARVFAFGIGSSANRFLLDGMARYGRGEVEYVGLNQDGSAAARRFHERVRSPLLTDIAIDWAGLPVTDLYPVRIPDLFAAKPVVLCGRYARPAAGVIRLRGRLAGREFVREIRISFPEAEARNDSLASLWARRRVDELMSQDLAGAQRGAVRADLKEQIVRLGMDYRLMTQFTSFVAVEETTVMEGGEPKRVEVPVEMPEGVSYEGVFGETRVAAPAMAMKMVAPVAAEARQFRGASDAAASPVKMPPSLLRMVREGKTGPIVVQVYLADLKPETFEALKKAGFELLSRPNSGSIVTGRIAIEKLELLAKLTAVRYIAPRP